MPADGSRGGFLPFRSSRWWIINYYIGERLVSFNEYFNLLNLIYTLRQIIVDPILIRQFQFSNFTRFTWSLDLRIEFAEYLSEYPRDLCNSNFSKFDLVLGWVSSFCTEKSSLITFFTSIFLFLAFFNILYGRAKIIGRPRQAVSIFHAARRIFSRVIGETFTLGNAIAR